MSLCVALIGEGVVPPADGATEGATPEAEIGGKARSLLRLARAGHRVPAAFAVAGELFRRLRAGGPALPPALRDAGDLAKLDRARDALVAAPWPPGFLDELDRHLDRLAPARVRARASRCDRRSPARTAATRSPPASTNRSSGSRATTCRRRSAMCWRRRCRRGRSPTRAGRRDGELRGGGAHPWLHRRAGGQRSAGPGWRPARGHRAPRRRDR